MKKLILLFLLFSLSPIIRAENSSFDDNDSIVANISTILEDINLRMINKNLKNRYKLYPTENMYNFLKLDVYTGRITQVQWSLNTKKEGSAIINSNNLSLGSESLFELYPTENMYQFLLLDKSNGRVWHVQWGLEYKERWIRRIP